MSNEESNLPKKENIENNRLPVDEHIEEVVQNGQSIRHKGIYILPNLFTTGNLFCGFYAIISAQSLNFSVACIAVIIAMILDTLDGRVARMTNTESKFGEQYDSLADMITFGITPAMIIYNWALSSMGKIGWIIAFIYVACAALRLARFNAQISQTSNLYFTGLPSPAAAALIVGMTWALNDFGIDGKTVLTISFLSAFITASAAILMISNIRYNSIKKIDLRGRVHFVFLIITLLAFIIILIDPLRIFMFIFLAYACSGPISAISRYIKKKNTTDSTVDLKE